MSNYGTEEPRPLTALDQVGFKGDQNSQKPYPLYIALLIVSIVIAVVIAGGTSDNLNKDHVSLWKCKSGYKGYFNKNRCSGTDISQKGNTFTYTFANLDASENPISLWAIPRIYDFYKFCDNFDIPWFNKSTVNVFINFTVSGEAEGVGSGWTVVAEYKRLVEFYCWSCNRHKKNDTHCSHCKKKMWSETIYPATGMRNMKVDLFVSTPYSRKRLNGTMGDIDFYTGTVNPTAVEREALGRFLGSLACILFMAWIPFRRRRGVKVHMYEMNLYNDPEKNPRLKAIFPRYGLEFGIAFTFLLFFALTLPITAILPTMGGGHVRLGYALQALQFIGYFYGVLYLGWCAYMRFGSPQVSGQSSRRLIGQKGKYVGGPLVYPERVFGIPLPFAPLVFLSMLPLMPTWSYPQSIGPLFGTGGFIIGFIFFCILFVVGVMWYAMEAIFLFSTIQDSTMDDHYSAFAIASLWLPCADAIVNVILLLLSFFWVWPKIVLFLAPVRIMAALLYCILPVDLWEKPGFQQATS